MSQITAIALIKAEPGRIDELASEVAEVDGVRESHSVAGAGADIVAIVSTSTHEGIAQIVTGAINKLPGVVDTETKIAFRSYSSRELDASYEGFGDEL